MLVFPFCLRVHSKASIRLTWQSSLKERQHMHVYQIDRVQQFWLRDIFCILHITIMIDLKNMRCQWDVLRCSRWWTWPSVCMFDQKAASKVCAGNIWYCYYFQVLAPFWYKTPTLHHPINSQWIKSCRFNCAGYLFSLIHYGSEIVCECILTSSEKEALGIYLFWPKVDSMCSV